MKTNVESEIAELLIGRSITSADLETSTLTLDNGTVLKVAGNEGLLCAAAPDLARQLRSALERIAELETAAESAWQSGQSAGYNCARNYHLWGDGCGPEWWDCTCTPETSGEDA